MPITYEYRPTKLRRPASSRFSLLLYPKCPSAARVDLVCPERIREKRRLIWIPVARQPSRKKHRTKSNDISVFLKVKYNKYRIKTRYEKSGKLKLTRRKNFLESVKKSVNREELLKTRRKESSEIRSKKNRKSVFPIHSSNRTCEIIVTGIAAISIGFLFSVRERAWSLTWSLLRKREKSNSKKATIFAQRYEDKYVVTVQKYHRRMESQDHVIIFIFIYEKTRLARKSNRIRVEWNLSPSSSNAIPQRIGGIPLLENEIKQILIGEERTGEGKYPIWRLSARRI